MFVILSAYGFTFNHFTDDNRDISFTGLFGKRISNYNLTSYIAFSQWLDNIEKGKITSSDESAIDQGWLSTVMENIKKEEYNITYSKDIFAYQSPNRANNYRFIYYKDGFSVKPRQTKIPLFDESDMSIEEKDRKYKTLEDWKITMKLHSFGKKGNLKTFSGDNLTANKNTAYIEDDNFKIHYTNNEDGMRQDFVIQRKPEGNGNLKIRINSETDLKQITSVEGIVFEDSDGQELLQYSGLKIWDSRGATLNGWFEKNSYNSFDIVVNDENAVYPVTIDPLSSTTSWTEVGEMEDAWFGSSVSSAGDVNGDGYSDVIIGSPGYDNGLGLEGKAYLYLGSATGLSLTASWSVVGDLYWAHYGGSVSSAGDVNGDGYSDVIVGAWGYGQTAPDENEGKVYVYHGSASGLSTTENWTAESNKLVAYFGASVSAAGDVNGDGCSDVIIGAPDYANPNLQEGMVFVWHGSSPNGLNNGVNGTPVNADWSAESNNGYAQFGTSVSSAGDVNGDGYSDVIIGADGYLGPGGVFLWYGSSPNGLNNGIDGTPDNADWSEIATDNSSRFGNSVSTAGDVNGDGYSDIIIGDFTFEDDYSGEGMVLLYHGSSGGLPDTANWTAESNQSGAGLGYSVSSAGDVNGDGYSDVIAGADNYDNGQTDEGMAFVWYGSSSGLGDEGTPSNADWTSESDQVNAYFGTSVSFAGDVNGDGFSDVIAGAPGYDTRDDDGKAYVYHGSASGLSETSNWTSESNQVNAYFGYSVSTAGDVNGDGFSDVIIGAYAYDNSYNEGKVFVYHGSASGLSTTEDWTFEGSQSGGCVGKSVSTAGDVNGDGYSDVIIGAEHFDKPSRDEGVVFVFHGSSGGLSPDISWLGESDQAYAQYGNSVSTAGDVNGDGFSDVIVGSLQYDNGETNEGAVFVYHGSETGLSMTVSWMAEGDQANCTLGRSVSTAGDVNGDGFNDVIIGADSCDNGQTNEGMAFVWLGSATGINNGTNGTPSNADWKGESDQAGAYFGYSVSTAGDVNGDGYSDVIVGAYSYDLLEMDEGKVFVWYGGSYGLGNDGTPSNADWYAESDLWDSFFGGCVSTAGDVNGDGFSDVIIGSHKYIHGNTHEGVVFAWYGSSSGLGDNGTPYNADWTAEGDQDYAYFGRSVSTAGDVNGDGYSDVIIGADGYDNGESNEGMAFSYYGNESDGLDFKPRQLRSNLTTPVVPPLKSRSSNSLGLGILGKTFFGRTLVKVQFEVQPLGTAFGSGKGAGINETSWYDIGTSGPPINLEITGLTDKTLYKWRTRIKYHPKDAPSQPYSRWFYNVTSPNGPTGSSIQVSNDNNPLPVSFLSFTSKIEKNDVILKWSTLNEINNQGFKIERKTDDNSGMNWVEVGFVKGNGTTNQIHDYQFTDKNLHKGRYEYRLKQVDYNGNHEHHYLGAPISIGVPAKFKLGQNYPNSFNPTTKIDFALPIDGRVSLKVYDIVGRLITTLINNEYRTADYYTVEFNGSNFASGVYFYQLITEKNIATKKMLLIK